MLKIDNLLDQNNFPETNSSQVIRQLRRQFRKNRVFCSIVKRDEKTALLRHLGGKHFEVCRIYLLLPNEFKDYPREVISNNAQFGNDGSRIFMNFQFAENYFNQFSKKIKNSPSNISFYRGGKNRHSFIDLHKDIAEEVKVSEKLFQDRALSKIITDENRLNETLNRNGYSYRLIQINDIAVLYEFGAGFEVCMIHFRPEEMINVVHYPAREVLPSDEDFGSDGSKVFFPDDLKGALEYFKEVTEYFRAYYTELLTIPNEYGRNNKDFREVNYLDAPFSLHATGYC